MEGINSQGLEIELLAENCLGSRKEGKSLEAENVLQWDLEMSFILTY